MSRTHLRPVAWKEKSGEIELCRDGYFHEFVVSPSNHIVYAVCEYVDGKVALVPVADIKFLDIDEE